KLAEDFERWCRFNSWSLCRKCSSLRPRDLVPNTFDKNVSPETSEKSCTACRSASISAVPSLADVPAVLRHLSADAERALRPIDVDVGPEIRAKNRIGNVTGYRQHASMIKFAWSAKSVRQKIRRIADESMRVKAKTAHKWLMRSGTSSAYKKFHAEHLEFLE